MKLSQAIVKAGQPLTYRRAWRRMRRILHPVHLAPLRAKIDQSRLRELQQHYGAFSSDSPTLWRHYAKYLDLEKHLRQNIRRAQDLNLQCLPRQEILDIGCGGGFFLFVAESLGHRALGLDVAGIPVFDSLVDLLDVQRLTCQVKANRRLPDFGRRFDLVTAFATAFQGGHEDAWRWSASEWDFLLRDLRDRLKPGGRIFLDLNAAYHGEYYTPEILAMFQRHDAIVERGHVLLHA